MLFLRCQSVQYIVCIYIVVDQFEYWPLVAVMFITPHNTNVVMQKIPSPESGARGKVH